MYYKQCTLNVTMFAKLKCPPMCLPAKLIVHQIYGVYGSLYASYVHVGNIQ